MNPTPAAAPHRHDFHTDTHAAERSSRAVLWITLTAMVVEITAGWWYGSMALLADGWHMSSHAVAIGVTVLAYAAARRLVNDQRFAFGTWKIEVLGGFASAWLLLGVAALMLVASVDRYFDPQPIRYREAVFVAVLGLVVNLVCAWILARAGHDHGHHHGHSHEHDHHEHQHGDMNLRSAYLHVLADALTSVLAIVALLGGWVWGWDWLDPLMGMVGAVLVAVWAKGLIRDTSTVLLDREMDHPVVAEIREVVEQLAPAGSASVTDLHVWRVGRDNFACAMTVASTQAELTPHHVRHALAVHNEVVHATIEVHHEAVR
jgi:cation diffusion facilitator family transporter